MRNTKKTKSKSKTTGTKKSTTKKSVGQKKSVKRLTKRPSDKKTVFNKCNKFTKNLYRGIELIQKQSDDLKLYVLWNMFWDCIYTTHSTSFISKHMLDMEADDVFRKKIKDHWSVYKGVKSDNELFDYQLCPMNKKRLENGMRDLIDNGGVAKFQRVLDDLDKSLIEGKY